MSLQWLEASIFTGTSISKHIFYPATLGVPPQGGRLDELRHTSNKVAYFFDGNLFQRFIQVIMITGTASFVPECGRGWMSLVLRGAGEEATV